MSSSSHERATAEHRGLETLDSSLRLSNVLQDSEPLFSRSSVERVHSDDERPSLSGKEMRDLFASYTDRQVFELLASDEYTPLQPNRDAVALQDGVVMKGFEGQSIIWEIHDLADEAPWEQIWTKRLESARASTPFGSASFKSESVEGVRRLGPCQYWKAEAYVVTLKNAAAPWNDGLLYPIVRKLESGSCPPTLFSSPLIRAVVWFKWRWARRVIFVEFCLFFFWLVSFLIHASIYEPDDLERGFWEMLDGSFREQLSLITSFLALVFMVPFSYISTCEVIYNGLRHWLTFWNLFDALAQLCQMLCFLVYWFIADISPNSYTIMLGVQTVLLVLKIQYFARAVLQVEIAFIDNLNEILREAAMFLILWITTVMSFAVALFALFKKDLDSGVNDEIDFYYGSVFHSFFTLFGSMFKRFTYDPLLDSERSIAVTLLFSVFLFLNTVTFYNLIVSIVVSSHKKIKQRSQARLDTGRAQMIVELETATPRRFLKAVEKPYIHFLRLVPPDDIDVAKLWSFMSYSGGNLESQKEAMTKRLHDAENEIMAEIKGLEHRAAEIRNENGV